MDISQDLVSLLSDLIRVESETDNEKDICDKVYSTLNQLSLNGSVIREKNSIIYNLDFGKERRIALVGHLDTVPVATSSIDPVIKDGELWGRGACDMKSGLAVMLKIIWEISKEEIIPKHNLSFVFYEREEGPMPNGINFLLDKGLLDSIDFSYVLEPTEGRYSVGCLGCLAIKKELNGVSAHSANPKKGKNVLDETFQIYNHIRNMDTLISADQEIDGLRFYQTINVTTLKTDNMAFNVIPAKAEMSINYRFTPQITPNEALSKVEEYIGSDGITILDAAPACYIGNAGNEFLQDGIEREIMQAWTDIAQLNAAGIPSVNFGAGSITVAHKPEERISITELTEFYDIMVSHLV